MKKILCFFNRAFFEAADRNICFTFCISAVDITCSHNSNFDGNRISFAGFTSARTIISKSGKYSRYFAIDIRNEVSGKYLSFMGNRLILKKTKNFTLFFCIGYLRWVLHNYTKLINFDTSLIKSNTVYNETRNSFLKSFYENKLVSGL